MNYYCATILIMLNLSNSTHAMNFFPAPHVHHYRSSKHGTTHHYNRHHYYNDHSQRHQGRPQHTSLHPRDMARLLAQQALFFAQQQQMQAAHYAPQPEPRASFQGSSTYGSSYGYASSSSSERRSKPVNIICSPVPADRSTPQSWRTSQGSKTPTPTPATPPVRDELTELLAATDAQSDKLMRTHLEELCAAVKSGNEESVAQALKTIEQGEDRFIAEFILGAGAVGALYSFFTDNSTERTQVAQMYADCKKLTASLIEQQKIIKKLQDTNAEILAGEQENAARLDKIHDGVQKLNENTVAMTADGKLVQKMTREEFEAAQLAKQPRRGHHRSLSSESDATEVPQNTKRISPFARLRAYKLAKQGK